MAQIISSNEQGPAARAFAYKCENTDYGRMRYDDSYLDVDEEKARRFIADAETASIPKEELWQLRKKYDSYLCDRMKNVMVEFGLNYYDHYVEFKDGSFWINGYTVAEWRMLVDDDHFPGLRRVTRFINRCKSIGDEDALKILEAKYGKHFENRAKELLEEHGLPADTKYKTISANQIDGMSFLLWRLLYDVNFVPPKAILLSKLCLLKKKERVSEIDRLLVKYDSILNPQSCPPPTEEEIAEADMYFAHLLD